MCLVQCRCGFWTRAYSRSIRTLWSHFTPAGPEYKAKKLETVSESESEDDDPPKLALARRRAIAAPAVTPFGVLPDEYNVDRLLVVRPGRRLLEYLVHWVGYGAWGDTWEPEHHLPEAEVAAFRAILPISVDLQLPIRFFREPIARRLSSRKSAERRPAHKLVLEVEPLKVPELALAVLEYLSKLCSPPVPIIHEAEGSDSESWTLYVDQLADLADVVALHAVRPKLGVGNMRINCGSDSYTDMAYIYPSLKLSFKRPRASLGVPPLTGAMGFKIEMSYAIINGKTGRFTLPPILAADERFSLAEISNMVEHAKRLLKQEWVAQPVQHELRKKGWVDLPPGRNVLAAPVAVPSE